MVEPSPAQHRFPPSRPPSRFRSKPAKPGETGTDLFSSRNSTGWRCRSRCHIGDRLLVCPLSPSRVDPAPPRPARKCVETRKLFPVARETRAHTDERRAAVDLPQSLLPSSNSTCCFPASSSRASCGRQRTLERVGLEVNVAAGHGRGCMSGDRADPPPPRSRIGRAMIRPFLPLQIEKAHRDRCALLLRDSIRTWTTCRTSCPGRRRSCPGHLRRGHPASTSCPRRRPPSPGTG